MSEAEQRVDFFDTSALVKRYHREVGTDIVDAAFADQEVARIISDLSVIECYSAFAKKVRMGEISAEDFQVTVAELAEDIRHGALQLACFDDSDKQEAVTLLAKHGLSRNLRTLDAMQLAVLRRLDSQGIRHVYCADGAFAAVIEAEGFSVIDPETPRVTQNESEA